MLNLLSFVHFRFVQDFDGVESVVVFTPNYIDMSIGVLNGKSND
jgi:hypothetical protein